MEKYKFPLNPSLDEASVKKIIVEMWNGEVQPQVSSNCYMLDVRMGGILEAEDVNNEGEPSKKGKSFIPFINTSQQHLGAGDDAWKLDQSHHPQPCSCLMW